MVQRIPVYVLSLARAVERRKSIASHLNSIGIKYEILDGVDGSGLSDDYVASVVIPGTGLSRGMIGCNLSHFAAYQRLLASEHDMALILEDDARVHPDVTTILGSKIDGSRFDICFLDCVNRNVQAPVFYDPSDRLALGDGFVGYALSAGPQTLHAYIISRSGAERRVASFFPMREAIDTYTHMVQRLRFYAQIGRRVAWVCEYSLDSMTSKRGALMSPALRKLRRHRWFPEFADWVKLTRIRHMLLARLLRSEQFIDPARRWKAMPSGRPIIFDN